MNPYHVSGPDVRFLFGDQLGVWVGIRWLSSTGIRRT